MPEKPASDLVHIRLHPQGSTLEVPRGTPLQEILFEYGVEFPCGGHGRCRGCRVKILSGDAPWTPEEEEILSRAELADGWRLACRSLASGDVTLEIRQWEAAILADHSSFKFRPGEGLGIAVDLGTTTLAAQLLDLATGDVLAVRTGLNPQAAYGGDVMSRIQYALSPGGQPRLEKLIRSGIRDLILGLLAAAGGGREIRDVVIVGNTVMHHLFCGVDITPLAHYPFEPARDGLEIMESEALGWKIPGSPPVRFLPCLGGFVGSDILAGIVASGMHESRELVALVDLGTNGEIVLGDRERMLCASTAAGPAFEGARIRMGMQATTGAISAVEISDGRHHCRVLGGAPARGICGSGLVDAVAAGLKLGIIQPNGRFAAGLQEWHLTPAVALFQADIRELQLAKAAIAAATHLLLLRWQAERADVRHVYLAGAFGNYVDRTSARRIGLINFPFHIVEPSGNTALLGAKMVLCNSELTDDFADLRGRIRHVPLAADPLFEDSFVDCMSFPEPDGQGET
jgi:uncharacterized 2Fe-2S/4Fe-4S cluster protein (DUF4445 family)